MPPIQKIKVNVADLISAVERTIATTTKAHEKKVSEYDGKVKAYNTALVAALTEALAKAKKGTLPTIGYSNRIEIPFGKEKPSKPCLNLDRAKKDLALLKMSADDTLIVGTDSSWMSYLS